MTSTTSVTSNLSSRRISPLLYLPVELRLQIYSYLLCHRPDTSQHIHSSAGGDDGPEAINTAILLVNRQLNYEATPVFYSRNTFLAHNSLLTSLPRLRHSLPPVTEPSVVSLIRRVHLTVRLDCGPAFDAVTAKRMLSGLEELTVELRQGIFLGAGCQNLRVLEDVRGVKAVNLCGSTTGFEFYLAWLRDAMMSVPGTEVETFRPVQDALWANKFVKCNNLIVV